jgi:hypothetical protein
VLFVLFFVVAILMSFVVWLYWYVFAVVLSFLLLSFLVLGFVDVLSLHTVVN